MHSSPGYDPNHLAEDWADLVSNTNSPLLNRAAQGHYPAGTALNPFLLAGAKPVGDLPPELTSLSMEIDGGLFTCSTSLEMPVSWPQSLAAGCPAPAAYLGLQLGAEGLEELFDQLGFYSSPEIRLPVAQPVDQLTITSPEIAAIGQTELTISPLQLALAAASLSNGGKIPAPRFLLAAEDPQGGWIEYQPGKLSKEIFSPGIANYTAVQLSNPEYPFWETTAYAYAQSGQKLTWYLAGTLPGAETSMVVVVLLEYSAPGVAKDIGMSILQSAACN